MLDNILSKIRDIIPTKLFVFFQPIYHWTLSLLSAVWYRFPSKKIKIIGVTGTKGKSSTTEILNAILEESGYKTALSNTIRSKIDQASEDNMHKMSMPGRFFMQKMIRQAVKKGCQFMVLEITSQGSLLYRHRFIELDALVITNISPEHIDAHGSYQNYINAKVAVAKNMSKSGKANKAIIVNADDKESNLFLECKADRKITYSIKDIAPYQVKKEGLELTLGGRLVHSQLSGLFNIYNILAAATAARSQGVSDNIIIRTVEKFYGIPGRVQKIEAGQNFTVIVDYAHTPDSLEKLYQVFQSSRNICVLGGTGGGRDNWKRKEMGRIADSYCDEIILTDEDPYDEDPNKIVADVALGITSDQPTVIMDRRTAIAEALRRAQIGDTVLITGKGTDPFIMGPKNTKVPWSDDKITYEEIEKLLQNKQ